MSQQATHTHAQPIHSPANQLYTRRKLLLRAAAFSALGMGLPWLLAACGDDTPDATPTPAEVGSASGVNCSDSTALTGLEEVARNAVNYVDVSPDANRVCSGCRYFKQPQAGMACGGCQIVAGPVAPAGTCNAWAARS